MRFIPHSSAVSIFSRAAATSVPAKRQHPYAIGPIPRSVKQIDLRRTHPLCPTDQCATPCRFPEQVAH